MVKLVTVIETRVCGKCKGGGKDDNGRRCPQCKGTGHVNVEVMR